MDHKSADIAFLDTPISYLKGVGKRRVESLRQAAGIISYGDLLTHYPLRYEDRTQLNRFDQLSQLADKKQSIQLLGTLTSWKAMPRLLVARFCNPNNPTQAIGLRWFRNVSWVQTAHTLHQRYLLYGRFDKKGKYISHPLLTPVAPDAQPDLRPHPVYKIADALREVGINSPMLSKLVQQVLDLLPKDLAETLPEMLRKRYQLIARRAAWIGIHAPRSFEQIKQARHRLVFEELFFFYLQLLRRHTLLPDNEKKSADKVSDNTSIQCTRTHLLQQFYEKHLPFPLTAAQKRVLHELHQDLLRPKPMHRLLQGDVGSGKTLVAWMCLLLVVSNNAQGVLLAPTELLAQQHYESLQIFAQPMGVSMELLSGSTPAKARQELLERLQTGEVSVLIGTHAVLEPDVIFQRLGLFIVDEQHRFGVAQRARLSMEGNIAGHIQCIPHALVMTATPIPRSLALTQYGDLDLSILDELPHGPKRIRTVHRTTQAWNKVCTFIASQLDQGHRAYVVYPLIEESEQMDLTSLLEGYEQLQQRLVNYRLSMLHGRMRSAEKKDTMQRFQQGDIQLLVATTVIEVGVHVPEATIMLINHAERFGLAQLHQLRGRIGREGQQAYCILMTQGNCSEEANKRIQALCTTQDGFQLAELDISLRGPGNIMGTQQSGLLKLKIADLSQDMNTMPLAKQEAQALLNNDPMLNTFPTIRNNLKWLYTQHTHWERAG